MSERAARLVLAAVIAVLAVAAALVRVPEFWADGATYHSMAWSLAEDGDLRYEARDVLRVRREVPSGPQGLFLKRASGGLRWDPGRGFPWFSRVPPEEPRIYFAKAFLYSAVAAPFVKLVGSPGLLLTNALFLGIALVAGYVELRRQAPPSTALTLTLVLGLGTVMPLYLLWPQPELFNVGLIGAALLAWRGGRPVVAAVLLGFATYSKPYNLLLALPLGVEPLLAARPRWRGLPESARRGAVLAGTVAALFVVNKAATGEFNYQGGERKTFYGTMPFEAHGVTFGNSGQWMTTDHIGPLVEGEDEAKLSRRTGPLRAASEIRASHLRNLAYFWIGRFGGAVPYFLPVVLAVALFATRGPRTTPGALALAALVVSWLFYIWMIPDNWYGGGGTVGNRYFLNLVPLAFLLVPRGREWVVVGVGAAASAAFLWPLWRAPLYHSMHPGAHATRPPFTWLPAELTMLNDLSVFTEGWRKKRPYRDTEGDPGRGRRADPDAYFLYFTGDGTYGKDILQAREGFWLRGGRAGEIVLRSLEPLTGIDVGVYGGAAGDEVTIEADGEERRLSVGPGQWARAELAVRSPGFQYYDSFVSVLRFRSRRGSAPPPEAGVPADRVVGGFVELRLRVAHRGGGER